MTQIRWGIVSAGRIAHTFAQDMSVTNNGVVHAVAARDGELAQQFADQYQIPNAYAGYEALYADPAIDAIYVATPHNLHLQHSADALRAGKAVLCEKPITTTGAECAELIAVAEATGSYLMEAMWTWFLPAIRQAKAWADAGRIGKIVQVQSDFGYPQAYDPNSRVYDAGLAGGCLLEMGVYPVALTALFVDAEPDNIAVAARFAPNGVEDDVTAIFDFPDCVATLGTSFRAKLRNWAYIIGEHGYIAIPDFWRAQRCELWVLDECVDHFDDGRSSNGFDYQIDAVNNDLAAGRRESEIMSLQSSLRLQRYMDQIRQQFDRR